MRTEQHYGRLLARNTLYNLVGQGGPLIVAVLAVPRLLSVLRPASFGVLALAWLLIGFFTEAGFGRAATRFLARAHGLNDREALRSVLWIAVGVQLLLGVFAALALALGSGALALRAHTGPELVQNARAALLVVAIPIPLVALIPVFRAPLEASQRFDIINAVTFPASLANYLLPLAAATAGWSLPAIVGLVVASRLAVLMAFVAADLRLFPEIRGLPRLERSEVLAVAAFGGWTSVSSFISPVLVSLDRFFLATLVSAAALGYYAAPYEMATRILLVPVSLLAALYPAVSALGAVEEGATIERLAVRSLKVLAFAMGTFAALLIALAPDLLRLWLGAAAAREAALAVRILALGVLVNALSQVPFTLLQGMGRADVTAKFHLAEVTVYPLAAAFLIARYGIPGAATAWSLRVGVDALLLFLALKRLSPRTGRSFVRMRVPQALASTIGLPVVLLAAAALAIPSQVLAFACVAGLLLSCITMWQFGLTSDERKLAWTVGQRSWPRAETPPAAFPMAFAGAAVAFDSGLRVEAPRGQEAADVAGPERPTRTLLVIGPTPPPSHGVAVYTRMLLGSEALRNRFRVVHLDTADRRSLENLGRFDLENVRLALRSCVRLSWQMLRHRPDVVYLPTSRNNWAYLRDAIFIVIARLGGARVIAHLHGSDLQEYLQRTSAPWRALVCWSTRRVTAAAVLSPGLAHMYEGLLPAHRVAVVPAVIEDLFPAGAPARAGRQRSFVTVAYLSALYEGKGYPDLLEAAARAVSAGLPIRFEIAGAWLSDAEARAGAASVAALGLEEHVRFHGFLEGAAKKAFLAEADIFVFPARQAEGLPLVVLEAMSAALPVVATDTGAVADAVRPGQTGYVVRRRDPAALADAIARLARDAGERVRMGDAGRAQFLAGYGVPRAVESLGALVEQVCSS